MGSERRIHERIYFSRDEEITVTLSIPGDNKKTIRSKIMNLSFKKGCYTGQEIVARMHYLGKLKKRMYRIKFISSKQPQPGDNLFAENSKGGSGTGTIVSTQQSPDSSYEALAVIQITDAENQPLKLYDANGPAIEILELPYSLKEKE